eukprot:123505-Prorocentrum_minimum.AAC.2
MVTGGGGVDSGEGGVDASGGRAEVAHHPLALSELLDAHGRLLVVQLHRLRAQQEAQRLDGLRRSLRRPIAQTEGEYSVNTDQSHAR